MAKTCWRVYLSGHVQGVGMRATVQDIANKLDLKGWVKNNMDGRVELEFEGSEEVLQELLTRLENQMSGKITRIERARCASCGFRNSFEIRYL